MDEVNSNHAVYRIQDSKGHGPFRPGVPATWVDDSRDGFPATSLREIQRIHRYADPDLHLGSACLTLEDMRKWVSATEYNRLLELGYRCYIFPVDQVWELTGQVVAGRRRQWRKGGKSVNLY
jgi:hypothetical protein